MLTRTTALVLALSVGFGALVEAQRPESDRESENERGGPG